MKRPSRPAGHHQLNMAAMLSLPRIPAPYGDGYREMEEGGFPSGLQSPLPGLPATLPPKGAGMYSVYASWFLHRLERHTIN